MSNPDVTVVADHAAPPLDDFRVDGWLVEPSLNRLVKGPAAIRVRPQLIDILACLAARPGQVVSKARLVAQVWNDRYIAESGISRCIAELRQVLEDDARQPRIIETIPKRGYRLIAQVDRPVSAEPAGAPGPTPAATVAAAGPAVPRRGLASTTRVLLAASGVLAEIVRHLGRRVAG